MSITKKSFYAAVRILLAGVYFAGPLAGQDLEVSVSISESTPDSAVITGKLLSGNKIKGSKNIAFLRSFGRIDGLAERVSGLELTDRQGRPVDFRRFIPGEYLAASEPAGWKYRIDLRPPGDFAGKAHLSWIDGERGILMMDDLLPRLQPVETGRGVSARIRFDLPTGWKVLSGEKKTGPNVFTAGDLRRSVFLLGRDWRETVVAVGDTRISIAAAGRWRFTDTEAGEMADAIVRNYQRVFGGGPGGNIRITLVPAAGKRGRWQAETRGRSITLVSGDMPFKTLSLQRLHEQLRHELFHLWIPNDLALTGNYDWFYEGFAVYQSLRTGLRLNQIRFADFLDTLARSLYQANFSNPQISLVESSKTNVSGSNPQVYSRGMFIAFLCDAAILRKSRGGSSIEDVFRQIYQQHRRGTGRPEDANRVILDLLRSQTELRSIVESYISGTTRIDPAEYLDALGLEAVETDFEIRLRVKKNLSSRQKDLLNELGYNNWRKTQRIRK